MNRKILLILFSIFLLGGFFYLGKQTNSALADYSQSERKSATFQALKTQLGNNLKYSQDKKTGNLTFLKIQGDGLSLNLPQNISLTAQSIANQFMQEYGNLFGVDDPSKDVSLIQSTLDQIGMSHVKYNQKYNGVPVLGGEIIVHLDKDLKVSSANGKALSDLSLNVNPQISQTEAVTLAKELWKNQFKIETAEVFKSNLYIFNKILWGNNKENNDYLVWQIELYNQKPNLHEYYFIDAKSGALVYQITGMQSLNRRIWDCAGGLIDGWGDCYLDFDFPSPYDLVSYYYGRSEGQTARGANPILGTTDTDDLYDITGSIDSYYTSKFSRNGANNVGGIGDGSVTFPSNSTSGLTYIDYHFLDENDYLNCPNAFFNSQNSIHFCDGYVSQDITGHEYAHAVNYFSILDSSGDPAGLTYAYESGALNENNSDVFGEALEYYINSSNDWLIGEDLTGGASRSMSDPSSITYDLGDGAVPYPDRFNDTNFYCGESDGGGVHINSSVPNHAAYLMAIGGTFNNCTINGIGREKEEQIFYRAQTVYYTTSSGFNDAYNTLLSSCQDLYPGSTDCKEVEKALKAVEMDQAGYCSGEEAVDPGCAAVDAAPIITNVSSSQPNGSYNANDVIDIDVTFSKAVTSTGSVTVTLETGRTDRTCSFTVTNADIGTCNYTVHTGDTSRDLNVKSIAGTITDQFGVAMTDFTPATNLATNKSIKIDTTKPHTTISPTAGLVAVGTKIKLTANETATIYYTTNGSQPTTRSKKYSSRITLNKDTTIKYFAKDSAGNQETYHTAKYTTINPASIITAPGPGATSVVKAFDYQGKQETYPNNLLVNHYSFLGGAHVAACDVDGDKTDELVTGIGPGDEPIVKVYEKNGDYIVGFLAYSNSIQGGVFVACGDLDGNGKAEIVTGVPEGFGPHVRVFNGKTGQPALTMGFFAYGKEVRTGIRIATGDLNGDGKDEIIVGAGKGAGTQVRTFSATGQILFTPGFFVYATTDRSGIKVAAGDVNGDGKDEIITGSGEGKGSEVKIYNRFGKIIKSFSPYGSTFTNGVKVASGDVNGDGKDEIVTGTELGGSPQVTVFNSSGRMLSVFYAYSQTTRTGVDVAVGKLNN